MLKITHLSLFLFLLSSSSIAFGQGNYASLSGTLFDPFVNTPQFGTITEASTPGREIQLGVRLSF